MKHINVCPMDNLIAFLVYKGTHIKNLTLASHPASVEGLNARKPVRVFRVYLLQDIYAAGYYYIFFRSTAQTLYLCICL
jgi:hypothetical protein